jgi:hypothetical protein
MPRPPIGLAATDDNEYRPLIWAKIAANNSYGLVDDLYNVMGALELTDERLYQVYPASITVNFQPSDVIRDWLQLRPILSAAKAPVSLDICAHTATPFGFLGDDSAFGFGVGEIGGAY